MIPHLDQLLILLTVTSPDNPRLAVRECFPRLDPDALDLLETEGLVSSGVRPWFNGTAKGWRITRAGLDLLETAAHD